MKASHFSPDFLEFISLLNNHKVAYMIVGGEAVIYYGHARLTGDIDFFFNLAPENTRRLFDALKDFWNGTIPGIEKHEELQSEGMVFQFGVAPNRIDLINKIEAVPFEEAWDTRTIETIDTSKGAIPVNLIGLESLIKNKKAVGRHRDQEDLEFLQKLSKERAD